MPFVLGGMALGRLDLRRPDIAARLLAVGGALTLVGYGGSWVALHLFGGLNRILASVPAQDPALSAGQLLDGAGADVPTTSPAWLLPSNAYSGTTFWIAGAGGIALIVLGICLLLTRRGGVQSPVLGQLANLGAMVLSAYSLQIVAIAIFGDGHEGGIAWFELAVLSGMTLLLAAMWRRRVSKRGPLETWLHVWSTRAAQAVAPSGARRPPERPVASGSPPGPAPGDPAPVPVTGPQS